MASVRDYYQLLGIERTAGDDEIKRAYRRLALKVHPDVNADKPAAENRFKEITEAYGVLIDPAKRSAYDRDHRAFERAKVFEDIFTHAEYSRVFKEMPIKTEWVERFFNIGKLFVYEAVRGGRPQDVIRRGIVRLAVQNAASLFHNVMDIHQDIRIAAPLAQRGGQVTLEYKPGFALKKIRVRIPPNVQSGTVLRVPGMGHANFASKAGDLYLHVLITSA